MATLDRLVPGEYALEVRLGNAQPHYVYPSLTAGQHVTMEARFGEPPEGSGAALLDAWQRQRFLFEPQSPEPVVPYREPGDRNLEARNALLADITRRQRRELAEELVYRIGMLAPDGRGASRLVLYAGVARHLALDDALDAVRDYLGRVRGVTTLGTLDQVAQSLVDARGDELTPFFRRMAEDEKASPVTRIIALVGLGKIGSERSVAAFQALRDARRALPGAPQAQTNYTHGERIAETFAIVFLEEAPKEWDMSRGVQVSEDYQRGMLNNVDAVSGQGFATYHFRRFGDEWLLTHIGHTVMS